MRKRINSSALCALAATSLLAGCFANGTRSLAPSPSSTPTRSSATAEAGPAVELPRASEEAAPPRIKSKAVPVARIDEAEELPRVVPPEDVAPFVHPLAEVSDKELEKWVLSEPAKLGCVSVGATNAGSLLGSVQMPENPLWTIVHPRETWGTQETINYLRRTIERVHREHPGTRPLSIGDMSARSGGHIRPHVSHQSGRDVDVGFYYSSETRWYTRGSASNLDLPRMWSFLRATVTETDVEAVFLDRRIQKLLREYAESIGEDSNWLDRVFGGASTRERALVTHEPGHRTHFHIRYYNPVAQETGRRIYPILLRHKKINPPTYYVKYKVRSGDSLIKIARKFKTSVKALRKANRLRSNRIYANRVYRIPRRGGVRAAPRRLVMPARRLPPGGRRSEGMARDNQAGSAIRRSVR